MRTDRRFAWVIGISLVWALAVTALFSRVTGKRLRGGGSEKPLVVAAKMLPLGAVVTRDSVVVRDVPERLFPSGGFSRIEDVVERPVTSNIQANEPVLEARIAAKGAGVGLAPLIPPGMRAISVRVNDVVGVAGFVLPGMRVDVLVTGHPSSHSDTVTRTALQNIAVLSAGQTIQTDAGKNTISAPVVTLLVSPEDAEALTLANNDGRIQLVLRNSADEVLANPRGRQLSDLYGRQEEPAPVKSTLPAPSPRPRNAAAVDLKVPVTAKAPEAVAEPVVVIRGNVKTLEAAVEKASTR
jgi:pilus assembly protein CpaB